MNLLRIGRSKPTSQQRRGSHADSSVVSSSDGGKSDNLTQKSGDSNYRNELERIEDNDNENESESRLELATEDDNEGSTGRPESVILEASIAPGTSERNAVFPILFDLRQDSTFCDVAFLCHGKLLTAHKCVVNLNFLIIIIQA